MLPTQIHSILEKISNQKKTAYEFNLLSDKKIGFFFKVGNTDKKGWAGYFWSGKLYTLIATNYTFLNSLRPPKKSG